MPTFVALLRAVNVGGTGRLPMADLRSLCESIGCSEVETYIQSGNVVFDAQMSQAKVRAALEKAISVRLKKPVAVLVRKPKDLEKLLADNPFDGEPGNRVLVAFYERAVRSSELRDVATPGGERLAAHGEELFVHYPNGQGRSKLKLPRPGECTARNLNTVAKLVEMSRARRRSRSRRQSSASSN